MVHPVKSLSKPVRAKSRTRTKFENIVVTTYLASGAEAFTLDVTPHVFDMLRAHPEEFRSLVERYSQLFDQRRQRVGGFSVNIDADGQPQIAPLPEQESEAADGTSGLQSALAAARERGQALFADILSRPEMLSADALAARLGISRVTVNTRRQADQLLALHGARRGYRFPEWQIDEQGKAFGELPALFALFGGDAWSVYHFLVQRHAALDGQTGKDALLSHRGEAVLDAARAQREGTFA